MVVFCFTHVGDAVAVRNTFMRCVQGFRLILTYTGHERKRKQVSVWHHQGVTGGVVRGAGRQLIGALCNLVGFYIVGLPIGASLMFAANMGIVGKNVLQLVPYVVLSPPYHGTFTIAIKTLLSSLKKGLWTGLTVSVGLQSIFFLTLLYKLDWKKAAQEVSSFWLRPEIHLNLKTVINHCLKWLSSGSCESRSPNQGRKRDGKYR